jgi:uncharacterized protein YjbJ (UPF0337 family)
MRMNLHTIEASWKQFTGELKRRWSTLVDEPFDLLMGKRDRAKPVAAEQQGPRQETELPK